MDPIAILPRNVSTIRNGRPLVSLDQFNSTEVEIIIYPFPAS